MLKSVAYVLPRFPVYSEAFVGVEMRAMERRGHRIIPFSYESGELEYRPEDQPLKAKTRYLSQKVGRTVPYMLARYFWRLPGMLPFLFLQRGMPASTLLARACELAREVKRAGCDHIHAHFAQHTAGVAIVAAKLCGVSVSLASHGADVYRAPVDLALNLRAADFSVAVCREQQRYFQSQTKQPVALIYHGVEVERFPWHCPDEEQLSLPLLFIGRLAEKSGLTLLLEALAALPSEFRPQLHIVGKGPLRAALQQQVERLALGPQVQFLGRRGSNWFATHASGYQALVAPFTRAKNGDRYAAPSVVTGAMALGLPVVTTAFMGCSDFISDDCGIKVGSGSVEALVSGLNQLRATPLEQRQVWSTEARRQVMQNYRVDLQALRLSLQIQQCHRSGREVDSYPKEKAHGLR